MTYNFQCTQLIICYFLENDRNIAAQVAQISLLDGNKRLNYKVSLFLTPFKLIKDNMSHKQNHVQLYAMIHSIVTKYFLRGNYFPLH